MFTSTKKWVVIIFVLLVVSGLFYYKNYKVADFTSDFEKLLEKCSSSRVVTGNSLDYTCFKGGIRKSLNAGNLNLMMSTLEDVFSKQSGNSRPYGSLTCHGPAHAIGEVAFKKGITLTQVINSCDRKCDYGCLHGAFVTMIRNTPDFLNNYKAMCDQFQNNYIEKDLTSCYHILGHGIIDWVKGDVDRSIGLCKELESDSARTSCVQGVLMESLLGSDENSIPFDADKGDIVKYCSSLPADYSHLCYEMTGFYSYTLMTDKDRAANVCSEVPPHYQSNCFKNLGQRVFFEYTSSAEGIRNYCGLLGKYRFNCILGAIESIVDFDPDLKLASVICDAEAGVNKEGCYKKLGDRIEYAYGKDKRVSFCNRVLGNENVYCME
jgi:hypothetical protein